MTPRKTDVPTLLLLAVMYALLAGNAVLYYTAPLHPLAHVAIGAIAIHFAFTIWHEAVHGTVSGSPRVNDAVGVLGMLPYMTPFFLQRWLHLEHHRRLNQPDDPNHVYTDGLFVTLPFRYPRALAHARRLLPTDPRTAPQRRSDTATSALVVGVLGLAIATGHGLDFLVLWFAPVVVAKLVMDWYINYLPHRGLDADGFRGTRITAVGWLTPLVLNHNYHAVHHIWPTVPWHRYREIYRNKRDYLIRNGVPIEHRVTFSPPEPARTHRENARAR
jgi:fatty acid desaturase